MAAEIYKSFANAAERAELVDKICDAYATPTGPRIKAFLVAAGRDFSHNDIRALLPLAKAENIRRLQDLAGKLSNILRVNPPQSEIKREALRLGVKISDQHTYERLRAMLLAYPELWADKVESESAKIVFGHADWQAFQRILNMLGTSKSATVSTLTRAFVIAVDEGMIDPIDIIARSRNAKDADILRASAIFDRMDFSEK
jgi:hypothetical protein